jgi:replicative DNA helicase
VIVDYLQLVSGAGKFDSRANEVSSISRGLKRMAKEFRLPVVALSQLNREPSKGDREPELRDLRESGSIEQDANEVIFLHFTTMWDEINPWGDLFALLKKNRGGPIGNIPMRFYSPTGLFTEVEKEGREYEENQ